MQLIKAHLQTMNDSTVSPLILAFVSNLYFGVRIESVAENLDYRVKFIERAEEIAPFDPTVPGQQLAEHLEGRTGTLVDKITTWRPAVILFDLNHQDLPWKKWIAVIKSGPATRRIPVLAFGSHMDVETMKAAKSAGADEVLARSKFVADLPKLIGKYARIPDYESIEDACEEPLSELGLEGIELYNQGDYFEAHELLEDAWNEDESAAKELYRAILQVGVAYLQIERGNYRGALKMFLRSRQWLASLPDRCRGVDVAQLRQDAEAVENLLRTLGPVKLDEFDKTLFKPVRYILPEEG